MRGRRRALRAAAAGTMVWVAVAASAAAQTRVVSGQAGILAEWELTAIVTGNATDGGRRWSGPLTMKHIGFCSADGPEEKTGEMRLSLSDPPGQASATLLIDGTECVFKGHLADGYDGVMSCPDRRDVPMMLDIQ